jgi:hypothetical protein
VEESKSKQVPTDCLGIYGFSSIYANTWQLCQTPCYMSRPIGCIDAGLSSRGPICVSFCVKDSGGGKWRQRAKILLNYCSIFHLIICSTSILTMSSHKLSCFLSQQWQWRSSWCNGRKRNVSFIGKRSSLCLTSRENLEAGRIVGSTEPAVLWKLMTPCKRKLTCLLQKALCVMATT